MKSSVVTVDECAKALNVTSNTVRGWLREGAPRESDGRPGAGCAARVIVSKIAAWRARRFGVSDQSHAEILANVAEGLDDVFRRDAGDGLPLHRSIGVSDAKVAAILVAAYQQIHRRITGKEAESLPAETEQLLAVCVTSTASNTRRRF